MQTWRRLHHWSMPSSITLCSTPIHASIRFCLISTTSCTFLVGSLPHSLGLTIWLSSCNAPLVAGMRIVNLFIKPTAPIWIDQIRHVHLGWRVLANSYALISNGRAQWPKILGCTDARTVWETVLFSSVYATDWWNKDGYFARWTRLYKRGKFLQGRPRPCQAKMLWHKAEARSQSPMSLLLIFWPRTGISWQFISSERLLYFELPTHTSLTLFKCMSYTSIAMKWWNT